MELLTSLILFIFGLTVGHIGAHYAMRSYHSTRWKVFVLTLYAMGYLYVSFKAGGLF